MKSLRGEALGVVGGLGPLASAEFVRTVYRCASWDREQEAPRVLMDSNPAFPDRSSAFLAGEDDAVLRMLVEVLDGLVRLGATRLLICCMTAHHLLPRLSAELRRRIVPVPEVIVAQLRRATGRYLVLCTSGTRRLSLLERQPGWEEVADRVVFPDAADQDLVHHELIYRLKRMTDPAALAPLVSSLRARYGADGFVVGCSEIHLLANHLYGGVEHPECIDPFLAIASSLARGEPAAPARMPWSAFGVEGIGERRDSALVAAAAGMTRRCPGGAAAEPAARHGRPARGPVPGGVARPVSPAPAGARFENHPAAAPASGSHLSTTGEPCPTRPSSLRAARLRHLP